METQHQTNHDVGGTGKVAPPGNSNIANTTTTEQIRTRWSPTTEQISILKELYGKGIRTPKVDQIKDIAKWLSNYGKLEEKSVFYWFQNRKAREKKKRSIATSSNSAANMGAAGCGGGGLTNDHQLLVPLHKNGAGSRIWKGGNEGGKYGGSFDAPGVSCPSSAAVGMVSVGHMRMQNQLRDCAISACGNGGICTGASGYPPPHHTYPSFSFLDGKNCRLQVENLQFVEEKQDHAEITTLPLFPMHGDYHHQDSTTNNHGAAAAAADGAAATRAVSLELSLNSYGYS